jgi:hypothetical protein
LGTIPLVGVGGAGAADVYAVGGNPTRIYERDENGWTTVYDTVPPVGAATLRAVWASSPTNIYHLGNHNPHIVPDAYSTKGLRK